MDWVFVFIIAVIAAPAFYVTLLLKSDETRKGGGQMIDISGLEIVGVRVREDGKVLWVNGPEGCILRICNVAHLIVTDDRPDASRRDDDNEGT